MNAREIALASCLEGNFPIKPHTYATKLARHPSCALPPATNDTAAPSQFASSSDAVNHNTMVSAAPAPTRGTKRRRSQAPTDQFWACPYYKRDPWSHYLCVEKHKLKRLADVKQHLRRSHEAHDTDTGCTANCDEEQRWYRLWDNLFKGQKWPLSPYVGEGIAEPIALLSERAEDLLVDKLPSLLQHLGIEADDDILPRLRCGIKQIVFDPSYARAAVGAAVPKFRSRENCTVSSTENSPVHPNSNPSADQISYNTVRGLHGLAPAPPLIRDEFLLQNDQSSSFHASVPNGIPTNFVTIDLSIDGFFMQDASSTIEFSHFPNQTGDLLLPSDELEWAWQTGNVLN